MFDFTNLTPQHSNSLDDLGQGHLVLYYYKFFSSSEKGTKTNIVGMTRH